MSKFKIFTDPDNDDKYVVITFFSKINVRVYIDFDINKYNKISGVYLLNNHYIGSSCDIVKRIKQHIQMAIIGKHHNSKLIQSIREDWEYGDYFIYFSLLDKDMDTEYVWYQKYKDWRFPLVNIDIKNMRGYES